MSLRPLTLLVHETARDIRPRGDGPCAAGRDSTQPRGPIRSSVAWGVAGGTWAELPRGGETLGRCAAHRRELGPSFRAGRICGSGRWRARRAAVAIEPEAKDTDRGSAATPPRRLRVTGSTLGWPVIVVVSEEAVWRDATGPAVSATLSAIGFSPAHAPTRGRPSRSGRTSGGKKNSGCWQRIPPSTCGRWMKFTSNSTEADAACGFRPKSKTRYVSTLRCAKRSAISERSVCAMASCAHCRLRATLMPRPAGYFCATCDESAPDRIAAWSSSSTTLNITTPPSMLPGVWHSNPTSRCSFFPLTARSSTRSSGCGNWCDDFGSTTTTSSPSLSSASSSMLSSKLGHVQIECSVDSVRWGNMRINLRRCV